MCNGVPFVPDNRNTWLVPGNADDFSSFLPVGNKTSKQGHSKDAEAIFKIYSVGVTTARDQQVYDFDRTTLAKRVRQLSEDYNAEVDRYKRAGKPGSIDGFVHYEKIKWSRDLKLDIGRGTYSVYADAKLRNSLYRPFCKQYLYHDTIFNEEPRLFNKIFPTAETEQENRLIWLKIGSEWPMFALMANTIVDLLPQGGSQSFPFYVYDPDGNNRRENITDWALAQFRTHYADDTISKWGIFYYVYGALHHPGYREKFADNLKRELPRIPYAPNFRAFADSGRTLADLHLNYETIAPYKLRWIEAKDKPLSYHVEKMRLSKDKTQLVINESLTLADIPPEVFAYRLGNRSALEWVIDQYQVTTDKRSGITSDPNREDEPHYIVDLVGRVIQVSVETVRIVAGLPMEYSSASVIEPSVSAP